MPKRAEGERSEAARVRVMRESGQASESAQTKRVCLCQKLKGLAACCELVSRLRWLTERLAVRCLRPRSSCGFSVSFRPCAGLCVCPARGRSPPPHRIGLLDPLLALHRRSQRPLSPSLIETVNEAVADLLLGTLVRVVVRVVEREIERQRRSVCHLFRQAQAVGLQVVARRCLPRLLLSLSPPLVLGFVQVKQEIARVFVFLSRPQAARQTQAEKQSQTQE